MLTYPYDKLFIINIIILLLAAKQGGGVITKYCAAIRISKIFKVLNN
jgi:hypothetical protein